MSKELANVENTNALANTDNVELNIPDGYICTVDRTTREGTIKVANALSDVSVPIPAGRGERPTLSKAELARAPLFLLSKNNQKAIVRKNDCSFVFSKRSAYLT